MPEYSVEKIVGRKIENGKIFYRLKWENYPWSENTWEKHDNLIACDELIKDFDQQQVRRILGAALAEDDSISYLIEYKDAWQNRVVSSAEALQKWPILLLEFLESQIKMFGDKKRVNFSTVNEALDTVGEPIRVTYVSRVTGGFNYWFEWPQQKGRFLVDEGDPMLKICYLESHLHQADENANHLILTEKSERYFKKTVTDNSIGVQMVTRRTAAVLHQHSFHNVEVRIMRNIPYEAYKYANTLIKINKKKEKVIRRRTFNGGNRPRSILRGRSRSMGHVAQNVPPALVQAPALVQVPALVQAPALVHVPALVQAPVLAPVAVLPPAILVPYDESDNEPDENDPLPSSSTVAQDMVGLNNSSSEKSDDTTHVGEENDCASPPASTQSPNDSPSKLLAAQSSVVSDNPLNAGPVTDSTSNDVSTSDINDLQSPSNGIESEKAVNADGDGNLCAGQSELSIALARNDDVQTPRTSNILKRHNYTPNAPVSPKKPRKLFSSKMMLQ